VRFLLVLHECLWRVEDARAPFCTRFRPVVRVFVMAVTLLDRVEAPGAVAFPLFGLDCSSLASVKMNHQVWVPVPDSDKDRLAIR
jgi:hypothetical protein